MPTKDMVLPDIWIIFFYIKKVQGGNDQEKAQSERNPHSKYRILRWELTKLTIKVCFVVCDNVFSQIFYNCSNVEEIFSWHN